MKKSIPSIHIPNCEILVKIFFIKMQEIGGLWKKTEVDICSLNLILNFLSASSGKRRGGTLSSIYE